MEIMGNGGFVLMTAADAMKSAGAPRAHKYLFKQPIKDTM
jgi:hypothetical protein